MSDPSPNPALSFIILSWNSQRYLERCLDSIAAKCGQEGIAYEVIVVDNGSRDASCALVQGYAARDPGLFHLIKLPVNRGTTYPRNLGLRQARGELLCILDSDTEQGAGSLSAVLERVRSDRRVGLLVPRLLLPCGAVQHSVKRFPTLFDKLGKIPGILLRRAPKNADFYRDFPFREEREVESAISACWFFRRELLERVGYLDERIFYAPEDLDYSLRTWLAGFSILYCPSYTVLHHTQQISHRKPLSRTSLSHMWGLIYYCRKHGGWLARPRLPMGAVRN